MNRPPIVLAPIPPGRCDVALLRVTEALVRGAVEPALGGLPVWRLGLGELLELCVSRSGIPSAPVTAVSLARRLGLLGESG
jgi:hypothetical protein